MPSAAFAIHALSDPFLADKPKFAEIVDKFVEFIGDAPLVAHNAEFDIKFLSAELKRAGRSEIELHRATDTVQIARRKFPGSPASLDALCKRFGVDNSNRTLHGALLDAQLLAEVYLELMGGRQAGLVLGEDGGEDGVPVETSSRPQRPARKHAASAEELAAHEVFLKQIKN